MHHTTRPCSRAKWRTLAPRASVYSSCAPHASVHQQHIDQVLERLPMSSCGSPCTKNTSHEQFHTSQAASDAWRPRNPVDLKYVCRLSLIYAAYNGHFFQIFRFAVVACTRMSLVREPSVCRSILMKWKDHSLLSTITNSKSRDSLVLQKTAPCLLGKIHMTRLTSLARLLHERKRNLIELH